MKKFYFLLVFLTNICLGIFAEEVIITNYSGRELNNFPIFISFDFKSPNLQLNTIEGEEFYYVQKTTNVGYFLLNIEPWQRKSFMLKENKIKLAEGVFFSKEDPLGWESEIAGFRMYDGKIDLYGKKKPCFFIKMIKEDKSIDIHNPTNPFGADILEKVAESLVGCGGLCYKEGDKYYNFGQPKKIEIIENKNLWNKFLDENNYLSFLQDFEYGEIEKSLGREVIRLALKDEEILGVCQIIGYSEKRKGLTIHHGPVIKMKIIKKNLS